MHALVRKSNFSKAQGLRETGSWSPGFMKPCALLKLDFLDFHTANALKAIAIAIALVRKFSFSKGAKDVSLHETGPRNCTVGTASAACVLAAWRVRN